VVPVVKSKTDYCWALPFRHDIRAAILSRPEPIPEQYVTLWSFSIIKDANSGYNPFVWQNSQGLSSGDSPQFFAAGFCSSVENFVNISLSFSMGAIKPATVSKGGVSGALGWALI